MRRPAFPATARRRARSISPAIRRRAPAKATSAASSAFRCSISRIDDSCVTGNEELGMSRLSITARLVLLSAALLIILIATNFYLNRELRDGADALVAEARYVETLRLASAAEKSFGDLKYWLTDLAVSLLNLSEEKARDAKRRLDDQLTSLEPYDATAVAAIRQEVDALMARAFEAVDAYTNDRRVIGNSLMAVARVHIS